MCARQRLLGSQLHSGSERRCREGEDREAGGLPVPVSHLSSDVICHHCRRSSAASSQVGWPGPAVGHLVDTRRNRPEHVSDALSSGRQISVSAPSLRAVSTRRPRRLSAPSAPSLHAPSAPCLRALSPRAASPRAISTRRSRRLCAPYPGVLRCTQQTATAEDPTRPARARAAGPAAEPSARRSTRSARNA